MKNRLGIFYDKALYFIGNILNNMECFGSIQLHGLEPGPKEVSYPLSQQPCSQCGMWSHPTAHGG